MDIKGFFDGEGRPRLNVAICHGNSCRTVDSLIDTGADRTVIPKSFGVSLGLKPPKIPSGYSRGIGGLSPSKYVRLVLRVGTVAVSTGAIWLYKDDDIPVLLGRADLFDIFNIEFRKAEKVVFFRTSR